MSENLMNKSNTVSTFDSSNSSNSSSSSKIEKKRKLLKKEYYNSLKIIILIFLGIAILYGVFFCCLKLYEKFRVKEYDYGIKIDVDNHKMVINIDGEHNEKVLVIIPGLGSPSPVLQYKPISKTLSEKYKVITMEPFGYGLSDRVEKERTIDNIVSELRNVIKDKLKIERYYLVGHSLGGLYSLYWSNKYPNEISGFIGFDTIVPEIETINNYDGILNKLNFINDKFVKSDNKEKELFSSLYQKFDYTGEEMEMFRVMSTQNEFNKSIKNEYSLIKYNLKMTQGMKFPKTVPVINFICSDSTDSYPTWNSIHVNVGNESTTNDVITLTGNHFYFIMDNFDEIIPKINELIK